MNMMEYAKKNPVEQKAVLPTARLCLFFFFFFPTSCVAAKRNCVGPSPSSAISALEGDWESLCLRFFTCNTRVIMCPAPKEIQ